MFTDTMKFKVFQTRLKEFTKKVKSIEGLCVLDKEKDGGYYTVKVYNKYSFENWKELAVFYKQHIKI